MAACNNGKPAVATGNDESVHANAGATGVTGTQPIRLEGCYQKVLKNDTAVLELNVRDSTVSGRLEYRRNNKDRDEGTIKGVLRNDLIHADYTFQSAGRTSVREVVFRVTPDGRLVEALGNLQQKNGKGAFVHKDSLQFEDQRFFLPVPCKIR